MNTPPYAPGRWPAFVLLGGVALAMQGALAVDRPGTPTDVRVEADGPTSVIVSFTNTTALSERVRFEVEQETNGKRVHPDVEARLSQLFGMSMGFGRVSARVTGLVPQNRYCFRVWSRTAPDVRPFWSGTDVRSEQPSAWACDETRPNPPLAPLDVKVQPPAHVTDKAPRVSWNTPDQSNWRRIDTYVIERQSPPEPGRPWLLDKTVAGPAGAQTLSTKLAFSVAAEPPPSDGKYAYRVCSENAGGRTCAAPVVIALTVNPTIQGTATRSDAATQRVPASSPADTKAIKHGGNTAIDRRLATIQTNQIICQGGATLLIEELKGFSSKNDGGNTLRLFFSPAWNGAGADGERLKPGECGFVDRGWNPLDPPGIFFETRRGGDPETDRLATYMRSAGHYWSFIAENTGQGSFLATRHAQWKGEKPAAPTDRSGARPRLPGGKKL